LHIADRRLIEPMHLSSIEHLPHVSEAEELGLATLPSVHVKPPRLAVAPIAMECRLHHCIEFAKRAAGCWWARWFCSISATDC
jgi:flavin reductase (DIM6/NTAB) family NADH-FMN oxidoreductase RutF